MPGESEADALLALMLLQHSRRDARTDAAGDLITLEHQDRRRWHREEIAEAEALLAEAEPLEGLAPATADRAPADLRRHTYRVQAEIAACHVQPRTDWARIRDLYARLAESTGSPVVALNLAVAVAMAGASTPGWRSSTSSPSGASSPPITCSPPPARICCGAGVI